MKDDAPMDSFTLNAGSINRYQYTKESKSFELEVNFMENCMNLQSYLISGVDVYIKLFRSARPFIFLSEEPIPDYKLKILDVVFKCATVKLALV